MPGLFTQQGGRDLAREEKLRLLLEKARDFHFLGLVPRRAHFGSRAGRAPSPILVPPGLLYSNYW